MEKNEKFERLDGILDDLKESSAQSKDYYKFIIGLATGTLVLSVTFLKGFIISPEYKIILIIGWLCLLSSIIAGVLVLPKADHLNAKVQSLKSLFRSKEILGAIAKKELQEHYLKSLIKGIIDPVFKDDEKKKEEFYQFLDNLPIRELKKFYEKAGLLGVKNPKYISFLKEFLGEMFKLISLTKIVEQEGNPSFLFKGVRRIILQMIWFDRVMKYAFFVGIFAISVFSIINFLG